MLLFSLNAILLLINDQRNSITSFKVKYTINSIYDKLKFIK